MAAESLLPLFHENAAGRITDFTCEADDVLAELLERTGDDLLVSLLEPGSVGLDQLPPPFSSPPFPSSPRPPPSAVPTTQPAALLTTSVDTMAPIPSPSNDGCVSDSSSLNRAHSPYSYTSCSPGNIFGTSPTIASPDDVMMTSSGGIPHDELDALLGGLTNVSTRGSSSDVIIDVDPGVGVRGVHAASSDVLTEKSSSAPCSSRKAATLVLTEEEKQLLAAEGISLPTDMPLTKQEQKHLKRVRRKIKNKLSAQESRKRKREYVEGLEERVQCCTDTNKKLSEKVDFLELENRSLLQQLRKLRAVVAQIYPSKLQAGTLLMIFSLSFSLLVFPWPHTPEYSPSSYSVTVHSRSLLFTETDEFGNIIDPDTGHIVSEYGGLTPKPPYPWSLQTPAFLSTFNTYHESNSQNPFVNRRRDL